jgi:hypothetical protein
LERVLNFYPGKIGLNALIIGQFDRDYEAADVQVALFALKHRGISYPSSKH